MATIKNSRKVYEGVIVDVSKVTFDLEDNHVFEAEVVNHPGGVCVAASSDNNQSFYLVKQFRFGANKTLLEFPAGLIDPNESPKKAALRELQEEIGFKANELVDLGKLYLSPGGSDEVIYLFYAYNLEHVGQNLDETESITIESLPFKTLLKQVTDGTIEDAKTVALTYRLETYLNNTKQGA